MTWNYGDILDAIATVIPPDAPALIHGDRVLSWAQTTRRSNNLARRLLDLGVRPGAKVAFYMRNRPEYLEALAACFKARLVHANVNYRYQREEVYYILDNSDACVLVYDTEFAPVVAALKSRLDPRTTFIEVGDGGVAAPFALRYDELVADGDGMPLSIERSPDDMLFVYTGGTTGMPKGVMWSHGDNREALLLALRPIGDPVAAATTLPELVDVVTRIGPGPRFLPACPLMHATGLVSAIGNMMSGGCVVTLPGDTFDPEVLWDAVADNRVSSLVIVGDAFAKPMLASLDAAPGTRDLSCVASILSSGVMWSSEVKRGLLAHLPGATLIDQFGASEGMGFGSAVTTRAGESETASFKIGNRCMVLDENDKPIAPGSGRSGVIALRGPLPLGYYKDALKTSATFRTIDGERYSIPGDWCQVEADGTLRLLGRGSTSINTAGEKVHPEEVEEALKTHPAVEDALVIGVADPKWGQAVTAVVATAQGSMFEEEALRRHVRGLLAGYKTPKRVLMATIPLRAANGKADYKGVTEFALRALAEPHDSTKFVKSAAASR